MFSCHCLLSHVAHGNPCFHHWLCFNFCSFLSTHCFWDQLFYTYKISILSLFLHLYLHMYHYFSKFISIRVSDSIASICFAILMRSTSVWKLMFWKCAGPKSLLSVEYKVTCHIWSYSEQNNCWKSRVFKLKVSLLKVNGGCLRGWNFILFSMFNQCEGSGYRKFPPRWIIIDQNKSLALISVEHKPATLQKLWKQAFVNHTIETTLSDCHSLDDLCWH